MYSNSREGLARTIIVGQEGCHVYHGETYLNCNLYFVGFDFLLNKLCVGDIADIR